MQLIFNLQDGDSFSLNAGLPADYRSFILRGADASSHQSSSELIILQDFQREDFSIRLGIYKFIHLVRSFLQPPAFTTGSLLAFKNDFNGKLNEKYRIKLKAGEFNFVDYSGNTLLAEFRAGKEYHILDVSWSQELISKTISHLEQLPEEFEKLRLDPKTSLLLKSHSAGKNALELIHELLRSPYKPAENEIFIEFKIREYLFLLLMESSKPEEPQVLISKQEKDELLGLKERLENNPLGKFPIKYLTKEIGMNEWKLKIAFKQLFGKPIFEFHTDQRMKEALRLLRETDLSVKQIAGLVGYSRTTSFVTRFKEHFGYSSSQVQRRF